MPDSDVPARPDAAAVAVADSYLQQMTVGIEAGDYAAVSDAARDGWYEILTHRGAAARVLLEPVPAHDLRDHPVLLMMLGLIYNATAHHRARALRYFATAVVAARRHGSHQLPPLDAAVIRIAETVALRLLGRPSLGVGAARAGVRLLDGLTTADRAEARNVSRLYAHAGMTFFYAGATAEAIDAFTKGYAEAPVSARAEGFGSMAMLAGIHARDGELGESRLLVEELRTDPAFDGERSAYAGTFYRVAEAVLALERFDAVTARRHLAEAAQKRRVNEHWLVVAETEALAALVAGEAAEGLAGLEAAESLRGAESRSAHARRQLARIRGLLHLSLGDLDAAEAIAHRDARGADARIERARVALARGQSGSALKELKSIAGVALPPRKTAEAAALEVAVLTRYAHDARVAALARRLGAQLSRTGLRLPLAVLPPDDLDRVLQALSRAGYETPARDVPHSLLMQDQPAAVALTTRERAVLDRLPHEATVSELAQRLGVSPNTVKSQLRTLYRKLGVTSREDAIAVALDRHLLTLSLQER